MAQIAGGITDKKNDEELQESTGSPYGFMNLGLLRCTAWPDFQKISERSEVSVSRTVFVPVTQPAICKSNTPSRATIDTWLVTATVSTS